MSDSAQRWHRSPLSLVGPALAGLFTGLSAPGFNQWYLAWCAPALLFIYIKCADRWWQALGRGWIFGLVFTLVWMCWLLKINLPPWVGITDPNQRFMVGTICWVLAGIVYGATYAFSSLVLWWSDQILNRRNAGPWLKVVCGTLVFATANIFIADKPDLLLMPLTALEYTQYNNAPFLQTASLIGGVGLQFILVASNLALAEVIAAWLDCRQKQKEAQDYRFQFSPVLRHALLSWASVFFLVSLCLIYGIFALSRKLQPPDTDVSCLQCGFMLDVMRTGKGMSATETIARMEPLFNECNPGLVVCTETSLPISFDKKSEVLRTLREIAKRKKLDIVFGIEEDAGTSGKLYNAAAGVTSTGSFADSTYRKQYLIPCGEFEPFVPRILPQSLKQALKLPDVPPYLPGDRAEILRLVGGNAAPLVCGENVESSLCARSIKRNGNVITNISNLSWFQQSILSDQTIAMSALRAVENNRYYVYVADTGPSFVLDPRGKITAKLDWCQRGVLKGQFRYLHDLTLFNLLCP